MNHQATQQHRNVSGEQSPSPATHPAIQVQGLTKNYGSLRAVNGISFTVAEGEIFGLLGPNGAGKTTTLEMIEGLRKPDAGQIIVHGIDVRKASRQARAIMGVQLQEAGLFERLTVRETIDTFARFHRRRLPTDELLTKMDLHAKAKSLVEGLSGGQRQRLSIALALVNDPKVVFLDEPTTGLDPQARRNLWETVQQIRTEGRTVILTTHYMEEAEFLCDRIAIIDHGNIIALDTPTQLVHNHAAAKKIHLSTQDAAGRDTFVAQAEGLEGIDAVIPTGDAGLSIHTTDLQKALRTLLALGGEQKIALDNLRVETANLEDVFLQLTGRLLRE